MKERKEKTPQNCYYCKMCRMWYPELENISKLDHLYSHLYFVEALIKEIDTVTVSSENE